MIHYNDFVMVNNLGDQHTTGSIVYDFNASAVVDFEAVIHNRGDSDLSTDVKKLVIKLHDDITYMMDHNRYNLKYARACLNLLIMLREASPLQKRRERRDDTSAYIHEIAQATYLLWLYENTPIITRWLENRAQDDSKLHPNLRTTTPVKDTRIQNRLIMTAKELDISMAIAFLHDCMEDLGLKAGRLLRYLKKVNDFDEGIIQAIVNSVDGLTKKSNDQPRAWMNRANKNDIILLNKLLDRQHNLATIIGSDRPEEKVRNYISDTNEFLNRSKARLRANGTLTYVAQYLYDQCALLELYYDVRNGKKPVDLLEESVTKLLEDYTVSSVHPKIHPMICIASRIFNDPIIQRKLLEQGLIHELVQWDHSPADQAPARRAS